MSFRIVRHGGVSDGSKRGDVQAWGVDVMQATAMFAVVGRRQLLPNDARFNVKDVAEEIAAIVIEGHDDPRTVARILIGEVIPKTVKETTADRRRRFTKELESLLSPHGWHRLKVRNRLTFERREA